jgi:LPXTG-site transpeptidase (sortase) family protein
MKTIIGGVALSLIIISFLFVIFNLPIQDSYIKSALAASSQPSQNLVDDKSVEAVQSAILQEQAHLPINKQVERDLVDVKPVEFVQKIVSPEPVNPSVKSNGQPPQNLTDGQPVEFTRNAVSSEKVGRPTHLRIPEIKVDAVVEHVGLTSSGAMDAPKIPPDAAWFELGPRPGENGSAVIAGHHGRWKNGEGSVFDDLNKLSEGDKLYIEDEKGATVTFVVRASRRYDPNADASDVFNSNDGGSHLNLIVCDGVWNKVSKSYSQRLVVFTDKVGSTLSPQE